MWTSGAQGSDWGVLLARTDPARPKHRGITCFLLDMRSPGHGMLMVGTGAAVHSEICCVRTGAGFTEAELTAFAPPADVNPPSSDLARQGSR